MKKAFGFNWLRFSLRAVLFFILLLSASFAWVRGIANSYSEQHRVCLEATSSKDFLYVHVTKRPASPQVLRWIIDEEVFYEIDELKLCTKSNDFPFRKTLTKLTALRCPRNLLLVGDEIVDSDIEPLLKQYRDGLETLALWETATNGNGLRSLQGAPRLRKCILNSQTIDDAAIEHLVTCKHIEKLSLAGTNVTDACVARLATLPALKSLDLSQTLVTSKVIDSLRNSQSLVVVRIPTQRQQSGLDNRWESVGDELRFDAPGPRSREDHSRTGGATQ